MNQLRTTRIIVLAMTTALLLGILALVTSGCGGNSPSSASTDMMQLITDHKFGDAYDSFSSTSSVRAEVNRDDFVSQMGATFTESITVSDFTVTEEKIDGDTATVSWTAKIKMPDGQEQPLNDKFQLVKEDGTWKVSE
jgi:hypothetical protein